MDAAIRSKVRQRAQYKCEYCQIPEAATPFITFHAEHIIAQQHQVDDSLENLALSIPGAAYFIRSDQPFSEFILALHR